MDGALPFMEILGNDHGPHNTQHSIACDCQSNVIELQFVFGNKANFLQYRFCLRNVDSVGAIPHIYSKKILVEMPECDLLSLECNLLLLNSSYKTG